MPSSFNNKQSFGEKMKDALMDAGIPVFFLPEMDTDPRVQTADLLKWMKSREAQRRAGTIEN